MDYRELLAQHVKTDADVTIATVEHPLKDATHFGVVEVNQNFRVIGFEEKPKRPSALPSRPDMALVSMGIYVFKRDVLTRSLTLNCETGFGFDFGHHVIPSLIDTTRVYAYDFRDDVQESPRYWRDIGTIDSYYQASLDFVRPDASAGPRLRNGWHSRQELPEHLATNVCGSAHVTHSVLSPGVRIEEDAHVEDSVLMPGVHVGRGARLRRVIVEEGVQIPAGFRVGWDVERDRKHYSVSPLGVVVINETPWMAKTVINFKTQRPRLPNATLHDLEGRQDATTFIRQSSV
jgi:glucose-1-phosphate adenylyltransferase